MSSPSVAHLEPSQAPGPARRHGLMHLLMLVATFCWGANIVAGKEALRGFGPLALTQLRVIGAALILGILFLASREKLSFRLTRRRWMTLVVLALCGVTFNQLFFIAGLARTSVAHTGLIVAIGPVMVLVLSCLMRLEALTALKFLGMVISFGGVAVLTTGKVGQGDQGHWLGDVIVLAGTAVFSYYTILVKEMAEEVDALALNALTYGLGTLLMLPFGAGAVFAVHWESLSAKAWWGLAYMIVFGSVVPYLIYVLALTALTASRVAAFGYLQPVIASGLGLWLLAERITPRVVVGGILILLGVYFSERERGDKLVQVPAHSAGADTGRP